MEEHWVGKPTLLLERPHCRQELCPRLLNPCYAPDMDYDLDLHVGRRLRARRRLLGMTQQELAEALGVRFQQIQKYECAANRISATRLFRMAGELGVGVEYFFEGVERARPVPA